VITTRKKLFGGPLMGLSENEKLRAK